MSTSIVIPYFNGHEYLEALLETLKEQRSSYNSIILVDDSPYCTKLKEILDTYQDVQVIQNKTNLGFGQTANIGTKHAIEQGAKVIIVINQDTKVHPDMIEELKSTLINDYKVDLLAPLSYNYEGSRRLEDAFIFWYFYKFEDFTGLISDFLIGESKTHYYAKEIPAACIAFRANLIERLGLFDPIYKNYSEDRDLCRRILAINKKIAIAINAKISHRHSHARGLDEKMSLVKFESDIIFELKNPNSSFKDNLKSALSLIWISGIYGTLCSKQSFAVKAKELSSKIKSVAKVALKTKEINKSRLNERLVIEKEKEFQAQVKERIDKFREEYYQQKETSRSLISPLRISAKIPKFSKEIRLFFHVRNEELRLPYFLDYYNKLGVDRFFMIDNGSTDRTVEIAKSHSNIEIFETSESMEHFNFWKDIMLEEYGKNHWCILADADEIFTYPESDKISLRELCSFLDSQNYNALPCLLLDMYSDKAFNDINYQSGDDPFSHCEHFDPDFHCRTQVKSKDRKTGSAFYIDNLWGGMRERVFKKHICLSKISLLKFNKRMHLQAGHHFIYRAKLADLRGIVFHFKYLQDFPSRVAEEAIREVHYNNAEDYKRYNEIISQNENLKFTFDKSLKYKNLVQLEELKMLKSSGKLRQFARKIEKSRVLKKTPYYQPTQNSP